MKRRDFLKAAGGVSLFPLVGGLASALPLRTGPARFFVMVRAYTGMDATLGLDPWTESVLPDATDMFVEYRPDEVLSGGGLVKVGPACAPLLPHAGDFSVVNGVFMSQSDNGHDASFDYMTAGTASGTAAALAAEIAIGTHEGDFGVLNSAGVRLGTRSVLTSTLDDLRALPSQGDASQVLEQIRARRQTPLLAAIEAVISSRPALENFISALKSFGDPATLTDAQVLAAAFSTEVAFQAQIDGTFNLDTHGNHEKTHLTEQTKVWQTVADLFQTFKSVPYGGGSLFDHTTFMVITEFSRTPALNTAKGKDHNPLTNSVLLAGRGVQGGQVVGGSRLVKATESATGKSYHIAYPISYTSFEVQRARTPEAQMIFPENVAQTVAEIMGVDFTHFHSLPKDTLSLKPLIKV